MCLLKYCLIIGWKCLEEVKWCNPASSTKVSDILGHVRADRINKVLLKPKHMVGGGTCWADVEKGEKKTYVVYGISTDSCPDASSCFDHFWFKITVSNGYRVRHLSDVLILLRRIQSSSLLFLLVNDHLLSWLHREVTSSSMLQL